MGDLWGILVLALLAAANPTLLAATTIMMLLPNTRRLMLGYLLGAYTASITLGLLIAFALHDTGSVESGQQTLAPGQDLVVGALFLIAAAALAGGPRRRPKPVKEKQSWPERMLGRGSARVTFAVGLLLSFPGVSYLAALDRIAGLGEPAPVTALLVLIVALIQQLLLEVPLLGYAFAPRRTEAAVASFRAWIARNGRRAGAIALTALGGLLVLRGLIGLLG